MRSIACSEVARLCGGTFFGDGDPTISGFATDSRDVKSGDLFIAIPGAKVDGHHFVPQAMSLGAVAILAEHNVPEPHILVSSIVEGLANFGANLRTGFNGPVVGITGSAGKTTTKEFLSTAEIAWQQEYGVHQPAHLG
jgi:UDP-N-acetylmuramoyl-tripeptide--D-alanyl-D-alanine ligase